MAARPRPRLVRLPWSDGGPSIMERLALYRPPLTVPAGAPPLSFCSRNISREPALGSGSQRRLPGQAVFPLSHFPTQANVSLGSGAPQVVQTDRLPVGRGLHPPNLPR